MLIKVSLLYIRHFNTFIQTAKLTSNVESMPWVVRPVDPFGRGEEGVLEDTVCVERQAVMSPKTHLF